MTIGARAGAPTAPSRRAPGRTAARSTSESLSGSTRAFQDMIQIFSGWFAQMVRHPRTGVDDSGPVRATVSAM